MSVLSIHDKFNPRKNWIKIEENTYQDNAGRIFHFFSDKELKNELKDFKIIKFTYYLDSDSMSNKKSVLNIVYARKK